MAEAGSERQLSWDWSGRGHTPVATESMRNWLRPVGIEALRGAYDGGSKRNRIDADVPPHPGVLRKEAASD